LDGGGGAFCSGGLLFEPVSFQVLPRVVFVGRSGDHG
jgi:hypothetical protein